MWSRSFSGLVLAFYAIAVSTAAIYWTKVRLLKKKRSSTGSSSSEASPILVSSSTRASFPVWNERKHHNDDAKRQTNVVVVQACHHVTGPLEQGPASLCILLASILLTLPAILHNSRRIFFNDDETLASDRLAELAESDSLMAWLWLCVGVAGAATPVAHMLADDVISGIGLDLIHAMNFWPDKEDNKEPEAL